MAKDMTEKEMELFQTMLGYVVDNRITAEEFSNAVAAINKIYKKLIIEEVNFEV